LSKAAAPHIDYNQDMIHIDGSLGEGGGQVLRTSLALAVLTQKPLHISNIRANRSKPGLRPQHLTAVEASAAISNARVQGAQVGASDLIFEPGPVKAGSYRFDIRTAGATSLVLQTIFLPLSTAMETSTVAIIGGTHVPWSPCFHYLDWAWLPVLDEIGYNAALTLKRAGFYPPGGGRLQAIIRPAQEIIPLERLERGRLLGIRGLSAVANLPTHIAQRLRKQARRRLMDMGPIDIETAEIEAQSPGTFLALLVQFEHSRCCFFAIGRKGKPAERVADEAVNAMFAFLKTDGAVDSYLADQLLLPLVLTGGPSQFRTAAVTRHLLTNAAVVETFLPGTVEVQGDLEASGTVRITPIHST
jgi:RNA 3'-terminal phosphate cyclase (ATP)